jgi:putative transport protein
MHDWLLNSPIIRLFVIIALGYLVGEIRFPGGFRLGVAGVLFVGLACGAWTPSMELPVEIQSLGLVLFVYCIGLQAAPGFFKSFKHEGLRLNLAVLLALVFTFVGGYGLIRVTGRSAPLLAGIFSGALTSTPALGAVTETLTRSGANAMDANLAVVGYGVAYPIAILFVLLIVQVLAARTGANIAPTQVTSPLAPPVTIAVETSDESGQPWRAGLVTQKTGVLLTRYRMHDGQSGLATDSSTLPPGSLVLAVGNGEQISAAVALLGRTGPGNLQDELRGFEVHRYFVSNRQIVERPLGELALAKLGAVVSRLRRGDVDLPANDQTLLHLGDRVRVISYRDREPDVRKFFGNSVTVLTETGYFSFALGIILGLILGQIPLPIPGLSEPLRLGIAGGPLIAALVLGSLGRSGPFIWSIPNEVNLTLRHLGILFFLAAVGVKAGRGLLAVLQTDGLPLVALSVAILLLAHAPFLLALRLTNQRNLPTILGAVAGFQTQPAILTFAATKVPSGPLNTAYATVYPLAVILKIILAQLLVTLA